MTDAGFFLQNICLSFSETMRAYSLDKFGRSDDGGRTAWTVLITPQDLTLCAGSQIKETLLLATVWFCGLRD